MWFSMFQAIGAATFNALMLLHRDGQLQTVCVCGPQVTGCKSKLENVDWGRRGST